MNTPNLRLRPFAGRVLLLAICGAASAGFAAVPALAAGEPTTLQALSDQAAALPVTTVCEKTASTESGPFVLKVTNTSATTLKVAAKVELSVAFHADNKSRKLDYTIEAGKTWTISDLAAGDKVTLTATEFAPLTVVVK